VAQRVTLDGLLDLAAEPNASPEVRAAAFARLSSLRRSIHLRHATDPATEAHLRTAERDLDEAFEHPSTRRARPLAPPAPPGRPIGQ
jgi:hypothetical protein